MILKMTLFYLQYNSGKRTKKLFTLNIGVSRTSQKHLESNRVNVLFSGHASGVRRIKRLLGLIPSVFGKFGKYSTAQVVYQKIPPPPPPPPPELKELMNKRRNKK